MTYQMDDRDPLLDPETRGFLERRATEFAGLVLLALAALVALMAASYSPEDPILTVSTETPVHNWLGLTGALVAARLFWWIGWGSLSLAVVAAGWGIRCLAHSGGIRGGMVRLLFVPFAVASASAYASTLIPGSEWHDHRFFGLGGQFGDLVNSQLLILLPINSQAGINVISAGAAAVTLGLHLYVTGVTKTELRFAYRLFLRGLSVAFRTLLGILPQRNRSTAEDPHAGTTVPVVGHSSETGSAGHGPSLHAREITSMTETHGPQAGEQQQSEPETGTLSPEPASTPLRELLTRVSGAVGNADRQPLPEPELVKSNGPDAVPQAPSSERIHTRIITAIQNRRDQASRGTGISHTEPPVNQAELPIVPPTDDETFPIPVATPREPLVRSTPHKNRPRSRRALAEAQPSLSFDTEEEKFKLPPLALLTSPDTVERHILSDTALKENARMLECVLDDYGVKGEVVSVRPGPVVTMYELEPAPGLKASRVIGLSDDIARSMSALSARVSTLPGRSVIGIELPNTKREKVVLREILSSRDYGDSGHALPLALGKDISGIPIVANLATMPHLLIAGTTGSGKSVAINTMILSLLYRLSPETCRLIMIDPKMLELSVYDGIPHLLSPVVTDPQKAVTALKWVVGEMESRYRKMSRISVRNIAGYNARVSDTLAKGEMFTRTVQTGFDDQTGEPMFETQEFEPESLPYIVVVVDEMADLMMVAGKEIEACIQRLAQMARASGIHLIMATQRPSVDVITGTIKANFPTRISFQVTSKVDSRTILGEMGAEQLLGMGDMLYMAGGAKITRCHGPFVSDEEVEQVVTHLKAFGPPDYVTQVIEEPDEEREREIDRTLGLGGNAGGEDALYNQAKQIVIQDRKCSTSYIQRKLGIGYNKAARLVEQLEEEGFVSAANHVGKREILVPERN